MAVDVDEALVSGLFCCEAELVSLSGMADVEVDDGMFEGLPAGWAVADVEVDADVKVEALLVAVWAVVELEGGDADAMVATLADEAVACNFACRLSASTSTALLLGLVVSVLLLLRRRSRNCCCSGVRMEEVRRWW